MKKYLNIADGGNIEIGTIFCIGKNYAAHAAEMNSVVPTDPIIFIKPANAYIPDGGEICIPDISKSVHYETELVVVIGKDWDGEDDSNPIDCVEGYAIGIDLTLRDIQQKAKDKGHPWAVAKGFKTSAPISTVVPKSKIENGVKFFDLSLEINGETRQAGNTGAMERDVQTLIKYIAKVFGLNRGDLIFTGTPEGVGEIHSGDKLHAELKGYVSLDVKVK